MHQVKLTNLNGRGSNTTDRRREYHQNCGLLLLIQSVVLIIAVPIPDEEKKITQIFIFTFLCGASKGFMKALKAFIKSFAAP